MKQLPGKEFVPNKEQQKFLKNFLTELAPNEVKKFDLTTLALRCGVSPLKLRKWLKNERFKEWFYREVDEVFKLYARIIAKDLILSALSGEANDKMKMFIVKLFLEPPRVYRHEYKPIEVNVKKDEFKDEAIYTEFEEIKLLESDATKDKDDLVSE